MARKNSNAKQQGGDRQRHKPLCKCRYCRTNRFKTQALEAHHHERGR